MDSHSGVLGRDPCPACAHYLGMDPMEKDDSTANSHVGSYAGILGSFSNLGITNLPKKSESAALLRESHALDRICSTY